MIKKEQVRIGMRIVGDDPESPESFPYRGTVTALHETGRNEADFYIVIRLDEESMRQPEISRCCPEGIMRCFPWTVSPEERLEKRNDIPSLTYTAVETARGFLFFTHTEEGRKSLRELLQGMADTYFEPSFNLGPVCVYEAEGVLHDLSPVNPEKMSPMAYPYAQKPENFRLDVRYMNGMKPTAEDFRSFCHNAGCSVSWRNGNITDTLEALERYDRYLETLRSMPEAVPHERDGTRETRLQLQRLMDSAYDVRGHRTAGRILDDPAPMVSVEGVRLSASHRSILKAGFGLFLPRSIRTDPAHAYAWVDRNTNRIVFGSHPPGDRETVRVKRNTEKRMYSSPKNTKKKTGLRPKM